MDYRESDEVYIAHPVQSTTGGLKRPHKAPHIRKFYTAYNEGPDTPRKGNHHE